MKMDKRPSTFAEDPRRLETFYLVEATSFEHLALWGENDLRTEGRVEWDGRGSSGWSIDVGRLADMPVCIYPYWDRIDGKQVCFWEATSAVVDYRMTDAWLAKEFPRVRQTNAMNFGHVLALLDAERRKG